VALRRRRERLRPSPLEAESELTGALRHLWVMVNEHPELRVSTEFQALARNLEHVEESLGNARRRYNSTVRDYNCRIRTFPAILWRPCSVCGPSPSSISPQRKRAPQRTCESPPDYRAGYRLSPTYELSRNNSAGFRVLP